MQYVIIDVIGRFADPQREVIVFSGLATNSLIGLDKIIPKVRKKLPRKGQRKKELTLAEIKFSTTGNKTRKAVLQEIAKRKIEIFVLTVDVVGRKVIDSPENYATLVSTLLSWILRKNRELKHVVIDRHFSWIHQREKFNQLVQKRLKRELFMEHLDSQQNTIVSLADFIAGGIREYYTKDSREWKHLIKEKIVREEKITWKKIQQKR